MSEFFKHIEEIFAIVKQAVKIAETSTASGEQKRNAAIKFVLNFAKNFGLDLTEYAALIGDLVDGVVFMFNLLGVFSHKTKK